MWSTPTQAWDWIAERLGPFATSVTSVVPAGFTAYARILHPAEEPTTCDRLVRWSEVARWSGVEPRCPGSTPLRCPRFAPRAPAPRRSQGPAHGRLFMADAETLAEIL